MIVGIFVGLGQWGNRLLPVRKLSRLGKTGLQAGLGRARTSCGGLICMVLGRAWLEFFFLGSAVLIVFALLGLVYNVSRVTFRFPNLR